MSMNVYDAIQAKHGFSIPAEYRRMEAAGFFQLRHPGQFYEPANEPTYLWIPEAEWLTPPEILSYKPYPEALPGFIPFVRTGAGDHWCWWPAADPEAVVECPHDSALGHFDAPNFVSSLYRRCLEFATNGIDPDEEDWVRRNFAHWAGQLVGYFPPNWLAVLRALSTAPLVVSHIGKLSIWSLLTPEQSEAQIARELRFARLNEEFPWCRE
jgi:hypothetical protein